MSSPPRRATVVSLMDTRIENRGLFLFFWEWYLVPFNEKLLVPGPVNILEETGKNCGDVAAEDVCDPNLEPSRELVLECDPKSCLLPIPLGLIN